MDISRLMVILDRYVEAKINADHFASWEMKALAIKARDILEKELRDAIENG